MYEQVGICTHAGIYGNQSKGSKVILFSSMTYSLETGDLTEPEPHHYS